MTQIRIAPSFGEYRCTFSITTEESAAEGDWAATGWIDWQGTAVDEYEESSWDLSDLIDKLKGCCAEGDGARVPDFVMFDPESDFWLSSFWRGVAENHCGSADEVIRAEITVHRPGWITDASWLRVLRYLGWKPAS